ncbi:electron transfer flavoprotein subunit beta/FixA family protein [Desulfitobacterium chlororespirans]|uniref:Electron transfer flavoprotein small subunit n=1 Tax=Desulfitobacterium chlororespirans DSM 11544 TaxID=1121395 RepID=A0A1M7SXW4_9FIRM|nr:electron transfer flavoprotein subunit beta/FixA family protein [Desulfitobacterium chlororespirans]SHN63339.1 electron transfer flavoprotein beta subunit [Desulfitobacterium chlororespirans DSM 11544]
MVKILVCYKWVLDEGDIVVDEKDRSLDLTRAKGKISEYDRNALELGAALQGSTGCRLVAATVGKGVKESVSDVLSRGPEEVFYLDSPDLASLDSFLTAQLLAALIQKIGDIDLVICGEGSSDFYSQQVGPRLAALLGYGSLSYAAGVQLQGSEIMVERKLDRDLETVKTQLPAVVTVLPEINKPRIPGLKHILAAKKKPSTAVTLAEIGWAGKELASPVEVTGTRAVVMERKQIKVNEGGLTLQETAAKLIKQLQTDRVLS